MRDWFRKVGKKIVELSFLGVLKLAFGLIFTTGTALLIRGILVDLWHYLAPYKLPLSFLTVGAVGLAVVMIYSRLSTFRPEFDPLNAEFLIVKKELVYEYVDRYQGTYRKRLVLKALKNGLDAYTDKFHWTGRPGPVARSAIQEHSYRETHRKSVWQFYEVRFQHTLSKGDTVEVEVIWDLQDDGTAVPFISASIDEPTESLTLKLSVPPSLGVRQVTCETAPSIVTKKATGAKILPLDRNGLVQWEIPKPRLFHYYEIKWTFPPPT